MGASVQLALPLAADPAYDAANFVVSSSNSEAFAWIEAWPEWSAHALIVSGPRGAGKTHLAHIWQRKAEAVMLSGEALTEEDIPSLAPGSALVLEHADRVPVPTTLLHLLNYAKEHGIALLLTAEHTPGSWPFVLPDLTSRLAALPLASVRAPDDALLVALLTKLFADRQLTVEAPVIAYLAQRIERSFAGAASAVEQLDALSLERGRAVTMPLARQLLSDL